MREVLEPTAANASFPANRPTTTTSAALNSSWSRLEAIRGRAKSKILSARDPLHISMLCFFFTMRNSPLKTHFFEARLSYYKKRVWSSTKMYK